MTDLPGQIPSFHEPFINPNDGNKITRTWYRLLGALTKLSGVLAQPILVGTNPFFVGGELNSGSTLEAASIPAGTLLGNSSTIAAAADIVPIDSSLSLDGSLGVASIAGFSLLGNAGSVAAQPGAIAIGPGLTLLPTTPPQLSASSGGGGGPPGSTDLTAAQVLSWWRGA